MRGPFRPTGKACHTHAAHNQTLRRHRTLGDCMKHRTRAQREAPQIVVGQADMFDQSGKIADQHISRISSGILRRVALSVNPEVGHQHFIALRRDRPGMAELDPVHLRAGKETVEQQHRWTLARPVQRKACAIETGDVFGIEIHSGTSIPAAFQRLATLSVVALKWRGSSRVSSHASCMLSDPACATGLKP